MTIAVWQDELGGTRVYAPEGPFGPLGTPPLPGFKFGDVIAGDSEAEWTYVQFPCLTAGQVMNQGDCLVWDNSYVATLTGSIAAAAQYPVGMSVGTFWLGGRIGDVAAHPAAGNLFSFTYPTVGMYGVWVQRAGTSLLRTGTITLQSTQPVTNSAAVITQGMISFAAAAGGNTNQVPVGSIASCNTSKTFTATTVIGSTNLTAVNTNQFLVKGQTLSGTGIPAGTVIVDIQGTTVVMSLAATAAGSGVTITAANGSTFVTTTNLSAVLTNVTSIAGLYPNQIVTGTGIAAGSVILKIEGNNAPYKITLSLAATATANNINVTVAAPTNAAPNYLEAMLRWPYISSITV